MRYQQSYGRRLRDNYAAVVATLALFVALGGAAYAATSLPKNSVGAKQLKADAVHAPELNKGAVKAKAISPDAVTPAAIAAGAVDSEAIGNGDVSSADIGTGQVTPEDVTMPPPLQIQVPGTFTSNLGSTYGAVLGAGVYTKQDPTSVLEVSWTGTAAAGEHSCIFQIRIDGSAHSDAGDVFVGAESDSTTSVSATALFAGLPPGPHQVEIWARQLSEASTSNCTVGPAEAGIPQTFAISEKVV